MSDDKASAVTDPVREHLDKAENWLALAEGNRGELINLHEGVVTYGEEADAQRWYFSIMLESAKDLAELHRAMAQALYDTTPQRIVQAAWTGALNDTEAMGKALAEKMQADAEEFDAQTLRPGADPEPEEEGALWTTGDGWFYYAVAPYRTTPAGDEVPRWLPARHYAQVLRWSSEQGTKPMPLTWSGVGHMRAPGEREVVLRRPAAEERAAFYGPEPDPQPAIEETHERTTTIPEDPDPTPATLGEAFRTPYGAAAELPEGPVRFDATVAAFSDEALAVMRDAVKHEQTRRAYTAPEDRGMFRDRG